MLADSLVVTSLPQYLSRKLLFTVNAFPGQFGHRKHLSTFADFSTCQNSFVE